MSIRITVETQRGLTTTETWEYVSDVEAEFWMGPQPDDVDLSLKEVLNMISNIVDRERGIER